MNLHGPVRAPSTAGAGTALVTVSLVGWPERKVEPTTHPLTVLPAVPGPKLEPVSPALVRTLVHPARTATVPIVRFNTDGSKLITAGYPSGVVQIWEAATGQELLRIDTPPGLRSTFNYVHLPADWSRLYSPQLRRSVETTEKDGKVMRRLAMSGEVRVWDLTSGKTLPHIALPEGRGASLATVSPDGTRLMISEEQSFNSGKPTPPADLVMIDLKTGDRRVIGSGRASGYYSRDGSILIIAHSDAVKRESVVNVADPATGEVKRTLCKRSGAILGWVKLTADGQRVVVEFRSGSRFESIEVQVIQIANGRATTLEFPGESTPLMSIDVSQDGSRIAAVSYTPGRALVWDTATGKSLLDRAAGDSTNVRLARFRPDGKTLVVALQPKGPEDTSREPDPTLMTQPRLVFLDTTYWKEQRTLICPQGFTSCLEFQPKGNLIAVGGYGAVHLFDVSR